MWRSARANQIRMLDPNLRIFGMVMPPDATRDQPERVTMKVHRQIRYIAAC
jgi:hypothetical protein